MLANQGLSGVRDFVTPLYIEAAVAGNRLLQQF